MKKGFVVLNSAGKVVGSHIWGGVESSEHCPIAPPQGGSVVGLNGDDVEKIMSYGRDLIIESDGTVKVGGAVVGSIRDGALKAE